MGRWSRVNCNCPNRIPADPEHSWREQVFVCGHKNGILFEIWPGELLEAGRILKEIFKDDPGWTRTFQVFLKIADFNNYDASERLALSAEERDLWRQEIDEILAIGGGDTFLPYSLRQRWDMIWDDYFKNQCGAKSFAELLDTATRLCDASSQTGSPIEFYS